MFSPPSQRSRNPLPLPPRRPPRNRQGVPRRLPRNRQRPHRHLLRRARTPQHPSPRPCQLRRRVRLRARRRRLNITWNRAVPRPRTHRTRLARSRRTALPRVRPVRHRPHRPAEFRSTNHLRPVFFRAPRCSNRHRHRSPATSHRAPRCCWVRASVGSSPLVISGRDERRAAFMAWAGAITARRDRCSS